MENLTATRHRTSETYIRVRDAILSGDIAPAATVSRDSLVATFGASKATLRLALRTLQAQGFVELPQNLRVRVTSISADDLESLTVLRLSLDVAAIRLSVPRMTTGHVDDLRVRMKAMVRCADSGDFRAWFRHRHALQSELTGLAGARFTGILDRLFLHSERYRQISRGLWPAALDVELQQALVQACAEKDTRRAAQLLTEHLVHSANEILDMLAAGSRWTPQNARIETNSVIAAQSAATGAEAPRSCYQARQASAIQPATAR